MRKNLNLLKLNLAYQEVIEQRLHVVENLIVENQQRKVKKKISCFKTFSFFCSLPIGPLVILTPHLCNLDNKYTRDVLRISMGRSRTLKSDVAHPFINKDSYDDTLVDIEISI